MFWWMKWRDVSCGSLDERHISSDLPYDAAAFCSGEFFTFCS